MRKIAITLRKYIIHFIDFFYIKPIRSIIPQSLFRYAFSGSANLVFGWVLYFVLYNFVFEKEVVYLRYLAMTPHIAAFVFTFPITFASGFLLGKYVSFQGSALRGRVQLVRYGMVTGANILINYLGLKLLVEVLGLYPSPSNVIISIFCAVLSYFLQHYFTFSKRL
ncbi:GtrA family protein [Paludibacter sp.]|uniref:GtrA family protein n=1 Tax=Paludibacter sp. TaxID=1898105 RepID=UPI0013560883|nr:GtrA family protein [Paludibacter sp.]MTK53535.1 GtrA family protein [Paludibacter sp.]